MPKRRIEITAEAIAQIEEYAGRGATLSDIALVLDISDSTLDRWLQNASVKRAYKRGRIQASHDMSDRLWNIAHQQDDLRAAATAAIFWLKSQAGWTEKPEQEVTDAPQVQIYLPSNGR